MAVSSNSNAGSTETKVGAGALSNFNTENKSNGNFSGGDINFDKSKLSINNPFDTKEPQQPTFDVDSAFKPTLSGNLDIDLPETNNNNNNNTTYSNNSPEPTMTVDEVYGKSNNQPVVEKQGDYSASSNEKSNVETSTFGKQDEVSVTPTSVTENKGMVGNAAIQSVEGLDFQQKDKASVDVLDSKKKRDEVEAEDKADSMRDRLKSVVDKAAQKTETDAFKVGESEAEKAFHKEDALRQKQLQQKEAEAKEAENRHEEVSAKAVKVDNAYWEKLDEAKDITKLNKELFSEMDAMLKTRDETKRYNIAKDLNSKYNLGLSESELLAADRYDVMTKAALDREEKVRAEEKKLLQEREDFWQKEDEAMRNAQAKRDEAKKVKQEYDSWRTEAWSNVENANVENPVVEAETPETTEAPTSKENTVPNTKQTFDNAIQNAVEKGADEKTVQSMTDIATSIDECQTVMKDAIAANDLPTYIKAQEQYDKLLNKAFKIGNRLTQTDYNKDFVTAVAKANDFEVTLADGTKTKYSQFATDMATKSPELAKAMYEAKADILEKGKHPLLAKIERWKAEMSQTWLGSKITFADNKVRDQFNQMAKTDMRATYAAYNNVLNDETGKYSEADKAEASAAINQAKSLMTSSAALQASTGFLSGIGDGMDDGTFGTTNPEDRNAWQKTLNTVDNIIRITLGLGISPAANKAYQNMYYLAGDKVNNSLLFNKDFDGDGFALCQEYGNNAATGMIAGAGELATGVALMFNPASMTSGLNLITDSVQTFLNGLYGVRNEAEKSQKYTQEVLEYFKDAENIAESSGNEEAVQEITNAITQIENFELKSDEVGNLDNWLEGSGSNTADNGKFNQALSYDEWLKLIEADPTMREYAKSIAKKKDKNAQKDNADAGVNS